MEDNNIFCKKCGSFYNNHGGNPCPNCGILVVKKYEQVSTGGHAPPVIIDDSKDVEVMDIPLPPSC